MSWYRPHVGVRAFYFLDNDEDEKLKVVHDDGVHLDEDSLARRDARPRFEPRCCFRGSPAIPHVCDEHISVDHDDVVGALELSASRDGLLGSPHHGVCAVTERNLHASLIDEFCGHPGPKLSTRCVKEVETRIYVVSAGSIGAAMK